MLQSTLWDINIIKQINYITTHTADLESEDRELYHPLIKFKK
jgi:hypothetical protein